MKPATVSVVVPCYNAAAYIAEALESVRAQDASPHFALHEIIVVDDGSTDNSAAVIRQSDSGVRVLTQVNSGISAARNAGLAIATGDLIAFLDADDVWTKHSLASRTAMLHSRPSLSAVSGFIEQFVSPDVSDEERQRIVLPEHAMQGRLAGALLVRRDVFASVGNFSAQYTLGETIDWVARAEAAGHTIGAVEALVLRRRVHSNNSVQKREQLKADYLSVLRAAIARRREGAAAESSR